MSFPSTPNGRLSSAWTRVGRVNPRFWWGLVFALGLAVRCRQYFFNASYWYDEAFLILTIRERSYADLLGDSPYQLVVPPIFLWLTRALYTWGGDGEMLMRLPAFLAGVAALLLMIPLARRALGLPHAFWPFAFLAFGLHAVTHGSDVRPYAIDVLLAELVLLCALVLIVPEATPRAQRCAWVGLGLAATLGPWLSFPVVFVLGGASVTLALNTWSRARAWKWFAFNLGLGVSLGSLWWLVGRHSYYPGLIAHWQGWRGFPDWGNGLDILRWTVTRPYEIGNYANRDMGIVLVLLALAGGVWLIRRQPMLAILFLTPFVLTLGAALLGKYPLAHRTTLFLDPPLYLLAGAGVASLARVGRGRLAILGLFVVVWSGALMVGRTIRPDHGLDYRGAYRFIHEHWVPGDVIWSQTAVVYQTYYGLDAPVLKDDEFPRAEELVSRTRLWMVAGASRHDLQKKLEMSGGRVALEHQVSGLQVLLFEPSVAK